MPRTSRLPPSLQERNRPVATVTRKKASSISRRIEATFGFIDLAGFTALTEAHGDLDAADMATRFADIAREALRGGDRLVKTIGDGVLVTSPTPSTALDLVERILMAAAD